MFKVKVIDFPDLLSIGNVPTQEARNILKGQQNVDAVIVNYNHPEYRTHESVLVVRDVRSKKAPWAKLYQRVKARKDKGFDMKFHDGPDKRGFSYAIFYANMVRGTEAVLARLNQILAKINETAELIA